MHFAQNIFCTSTKVYAFGEDDKKGVSEWEQERESEEELLQIAHCTHQPAYTKTRHGQGRMKNVKNTRTS